MFKETYVINHTISVLVHISLALLSASGIEPGGGADATHICDLAAVSETRAVVETRSTGAGDSVQDPIGSVHWVWTVALWDQTSA